jgi:glucokinase
VGIGSAGPVDVTAGTVSPVNIPAWRGFDVVGEVARAVPGRPVTLGGDGTCMALGEYWRGGHSGGGRTMLGVVVSTGVGGGLVIDGRIYAGPTGNAGHIGHTVIDLHGEPCPCGGCGCVELYASGPAMVRWAQSQGWPAEGCSLPAESDALDARVLAEHARAGHSVALAAFSRAADALAAGIVSAAALVDLDDVVIGGGVAAAGEVLFGPLRAAMAARAGLGFVRRTRIHPSTLGSDAGLLGAAALVLDPTTLRSL